jgi:anti-sigma factor RsiW
MPPAINEVICDAALIAAYVDGELETDARLSLEQHLEHCRNCQGELQVHRIFICELDSVLAQPAVVDVPQDFSRMVAARATSDMSGLRSASENKKALAFCVILAVTALALTSNASRVAAITTVRQIVGKVVGALSVLGTVFYDLVASVAVIFRVLSRKLIVESSSFGLLLVLLALAVLLLSLMISRYHRMGATE